MINRSSGEAIYKLAVIPYYKDIGALHLAPDSREKFILDPARILMFID